MVVPPSFLVRRYSLVEFLYSAFREMLQLHGIHHIGIASGSREPSLGASFGTRLMRTIAGEVSIGLISTIWSTDRNFSSSTRTWYEFAKSSENENLPSLSLKVVAIVLPRNCSVTCIGRSSSSPTKGLDRLSTLAARQGRVHRRPRHLTAAGTEGVSTFLTACSPPCPERKWGLVYKDQAPQLYSLSLEKELQT
jgi:hypothetical protein